MYEKRPLEEAYKNQNSTIDVIIDDFNISDNGIFGIMYEKEKFGKQKEGAEFYIPQDPDLLFYMIELSRIFYSSKESDNLVRVEVSLEEETSTFRIDSVRYPVIDEKINIELIKNDQYKI